LAPTIGSIYGYELDSELPLRRLRDTPGVRGRLRLERGAEGILDQPGELTAWRDWPGTEERFALARSDGALLAWWSEIGSFEIDPAARRIRVAASRFNLLSEHRLATTVIPLLLAERGDLALHGSVVAADGRGVLFCGPSGRGKSTLALLAAELGHSVLSEDGAVIDIREAGRVWPGPRGVFVEDEPTIAARVGGERESNGSLVTGLRRRSLRMLAAGQEAAGPAPVAAICQVAERTTDLTVTRLSPAEAIPALVPNLIHGGGPGSLRPAIALLVRLVERAPVYRVTMPDRMSRALAATGSLIGQVAV
jgi:hypothetical protein